MSVSAVSPLWTAVSPNAPDTWVTTELRCRTRPRTQSLASALRPPAHPAAPQRRRGSSCQQVICLTHMSWQSPSVTLHHPANLTQDPSQDGFPKSWHTLGLCNINNWIRDGHGMRLCIFFPKILQPTTTTFPAPQLNNTGFLVHFKPWTRV